MSLDISSQKPVFGSRFHSFRLINAYSINSADRRVRSLPPESLFPDTGVPLLVVGDLNIHNPLADPLRAFSSQEVSLSAPYFELAVLGGFALLNSPGVYTWFPVSGKARPYFIDLAFANPLLLRIVKSGETSLPSTGSDHVHITILLAPPSLDLAPQRLRWDHTDRELLSPTIKNFIVPPPPLCPSSKILDHWLTGHWTTSQAFLKTTPQARPLPTTPNIGGPPTSPFFDANIIRRQGWPAKRHLSPESNGEHLENWLFQGHQGHENKYWSSFLLSATPQNLWTAKRFASG